MKETQVMIPVDVYAADDVDIEINSVDPNDKVQKFKLVLFSSEIVI